MSLRAKIVLILSATLALYAGLDYTIQRIVVLNSFVSLEEYEAETDAQRVVEAFEQEVDELDARAFEWASRDDTIRYISAPNREYENVYLNPAILREYDLNLLYLVSAEPGVYRYEDGEQPLPEGIFPVAWGRAFDANGNAVDIKGFPTHENRGALQSRQHRLIRREAGREKQALKGLYLTEQGPMMVSSRAIVSSGMGGPVLGYAVLGRLVDDDLVAAIEQRTSVDFVIELPPEEGATSAEHELWKRVAGAPIDTELGRPTPVLEQSESDQLDLYTTLEDVSKAPGVIVHARIPRHIMRQGKTSVNYALLSTIASGLLILLVLLFVLQRTVIDPIAALTGHAVRIGKSDDFSVKLDLDRKDEVGILSREFDDMMEKLKLSRQALVETARAAGMSEIATGVLHNVGNVLNSVNVSTSLIGDRVNKSSITDLCKMMKVVQDNGDDIASFVDQHPKGKHLYPFLKSLTEQINGERSSLLEEISSLNEGVEHIKELVQSQQNYAIRSEVLEKASLSGLVNSAINFSTQALGEQSTIPIDCDFQELPEVSVDRHRIIEILVNLIRNARQSIDEAGVEAPKIVIRIRGGESRVRFEVEDNGVGIPSENLAKIFNHGFTTKQDGHGFGLHASANAATEMKGNLSVQSDGVGHGAAFILEVPSELEVEFSRAS